MNQAVKAYDRAKDKLSGDFKAMIADSEEMLKAVAAVSGEDFAAARTKFGDRLKTAKASLEHASQPMLARTRQGATATNRYVRANPWTAVGIAATVGALIGLLAARR